MKLSPAAMENVLDMVLNGLPYDFDYKAASNEAILIYEIVESVKKHSPNMEKLVGIIGVICKQIDEKPESQDAVKEIAQDMKAILEQYNEKSKHK